MDLMSVCELQNLMHHHITQHFRLPESEYITVSQAAGRVLAQDILSPLNVPDADVSAVDGYALPRKSQPNEVLNVIGVSSAGHPFSGSIQQGQCVRIMAGAIIPVGCETVILQENVALNTEGQVVIQQAIEARKNIRYLGEEIQKDTQVLQRGRVLRHADTMLLAGLGLDKVLVYQKLRVAVLSTGDELTEVGESLTGQGHIFDSNRQMLMSRLRDFPLIINDLKIVHDNLEEVMHVLDETAGQYDVVLTSGGVSVGDYMREAVLRLGAIHHYQVAIKPGKSLVFGQLIRAWYFGLPGNPVSGFVGFDMFVKAALWQLCGASEMPAPLRFQATLGAPVKKVAGRMDIQRAMLSRQNDGTWTAYPCGAQDSHRILCMSQANAYLILPPDTGCLNVGDMVEVEPFTQAFL